MTSSAGPNNPIVMRSRPRQLRSFLFRFWKKVMGFVQDIETHHVLEEYKGSSFCWLSSLTWGKSSPTQYFLLGCLFLDVDTSL